ncbi:MAG: TetR/AcrR family transcriptional regulator [Candidatus Dormibacteria bacterium]
MGQRRTPGQRAGLTHPAVLAAARELLSDSGLDSFTMRALAERLDVAPNALYSHVASKTALIDDLLDEVLAQVQAPVSDIEDPSAGLRQLMTSTYDVLLAHPDLVPLYLARQGAHGPNAQRLGETMITLLARCGVHGKAAREALRVLIVYTIGFAAFASRPTLEPDTQQRLPDEEIHDNFTNGLRWLLAGILHTTAQAVR